MTRTAAELGAGLAAARVARPIRAAERIHVVGIAGAGASAAALLAEAAGAEVSGCDPGGPSPYTPPLQAAGIPIAWRHDAAHVTGSPRPDRLAVTKALTAVDAGHPELAAAAALGIPAEPWQQVVADAAVDRTLVAVAGTHGKSTTAGWLTWVLAQAGLDPAAFVGALLPPALTGGLAATARRGRGATFIVEADEYAGNFDAYRPAMVLLTTAEWDHPDVFADRAAVLDAFQAWLDRVPAATLVANVADPGVGELVGRLAGRTGLTVRVRLEEATSAAPEADVGGRITALDASGTGLEIRVGRLSPLSVRLRTAGRHNAANALVVGAAALELGLPPEDVARHLGTFEGIGRRLERKGEAGGVVVYDDYGHHPTAIRETLAAVRQREPGRRVWAVYEPLTFHRTAALLDDFAVALALADAVAVADIWAGRDPDRTVASAEGLAAAVRRRRPDLTVVAPGTVEATAAWLAHAVLPGDVVLVMGGGRSYRIGELLLADLRDRGGLPAG
jgi:UDP-N-acetylmuramate--alanine ligase